MNTETQKIKSWVGESILLCIVFLPFGLPALFYASKVIPLKSSDRINESKFYAHKAKKYVKIGFFTFLSILTLYIFTMLFAFVWMKSLTLAF